jgi:transposase
MFTESGLTFSKIIIAIGRSDLRRGIDGLCAMIRLKYDLDPLENGTLFLFCGTRRDRIKGVL